MQAARLDRRQFFSLAALAPLSPAKWFDNHVDLAGIGFRRLRRGQEGRHYLWIHGDEKTAHDVLVEHMKIANGQAFLVEGTERNVSLRTGKIDPNRMFSRVGAEKSLKSLNPEWKPEQLKSALDRLDRSREGFLRRILPKSGELMVALHNNGPGYSMTDEVAISDAVSMNAKDHPDEFMLCTQKPDFQMLSGGPFNVLLQNEAPKEDDGSLSRLCSKRGVRYVNIEAALGNADMQKKMLDWVERVL